jgi:cell wall-associated NlpC family hydrolase
MKYFTKWFLISIIFLGCKGMVEKRVADENTGERIPADTAVIANPPDPKQILDEGNAHKIISGIKGGELVAFAKTLTGVQYKYASTDPNVGFDCSGFITYVFNHFNIAVPRSSVDFTNVGTAIDTSAAREGDLILFTGTVDSIRTVGHMGIVTENTDTLKFIHSTSGKANGVTISPLNEHYRRRFVKVIRVLGE